ncbi:MAG: 4Fe-4S binding protein [Desulfovibrio sp.]|uniref:4Fe-4S binding protein n=1 Tax=Desulfovibrio sp. TaxID=885 RepID=UPI001A75EB66|nr:4Fe-4S binding protein [Desulfovibrio sp.]MBD5416299.1 4Fe-4S binding protein [Desulfovibrio sp.]
MAGFLKVLFRNLLDGPSTDPFPLGPTFTPKRLRGKAVVDPDLCVGCGVCRHVCTAGAIDISPKPDKSGYTITIWQDSCCLCANCRHYCPTGAMSITNDWHLVHPESEKYEMLEQHTIDYEPCAHCGTLIRPIPLKLAEKIYAHDANISPEEIRHLCPKCRQLEDAKRIERVYPAVETEEIREAAALPDPPAPPEPVVGKLEDAPSTQMNLPAEEAAPAEEKA